MTSFLPTVFRFWLQNIVITFTFFRCCISGTTLLVASCFFLGCHTKNASEVEGSSSSVVLAGSWVVCSGLMHLLFLFAGCGEWKRRVLRWESDGSEAEKAEECQTNTEGEEQGFLLLRASWKPSRGSRLDNLSGAPRYFRRAPQLRGGCSELHQIKSTQRQKLHSDTVTVLIYPACLWVLLPLKQLATVFLLFFFSPSKWCYFSYSAMKCSKPKNINVNCCVW